MAQHQRWGDTNPVRSRLWRVPELFLGFGIAVIAFLLCAPRSSGGRQFFSPDSLEVRSQTEDLLRGTEIPIYRSRYSYGRSELTAFLIENGYWQASRSVKPRWILMNHWNSQWSDGHSPLLRELSWRATEWAEWSKTHPDLAAVVWPLILETIRSDDERRRANAVALLEHARRSDNIAEFRKTLDSDPCWTGGGTADSEDSR